MLSFRQMGNWCSPRSNSTVLCTRKKVIVTAGTSVQCNGGKCVEAARAFSSAKIITLLCLTSL